MIDRIKCPSCGNSFNIEDALSGKLEAHFKLEYEKKMAEQAKKFREKEIKLETERLKLEEQNKLISSEIKKRLEEEKKKIEISALESVEEKMKVLEKENEEKKIENKKLKEREVTLLQQESKLKEKQEELEFQAKKELLKGKQEIEENAREKEKKKFELEKMELLKQVEDTKKLAEEMKRKAEQGSMQLQGEAQELVLEELLSATYPFDKIDDVPTGTKGADLIQTVANSNQKECGRIVYESKRTKNFSDKWVDKLKKDQLSCKADIGVIVTKTLPKDIDKFGERDGIWVCGFEEVRSLSFVLREMLIKIYSLKLSQENKGTKMEFLYTYLISNEFVQNIRRIVETYDSMNQQLNSEKKAMQKTWSIREKQIWIVQESISSLFGSIKGIAGNELETSNILELPGSTTN